ncbi:MAG: hypothetical protein IJ295_03020 [Clostridia bacterium]|nr:hypothetical protein [Clostridia bacterium]
MNISKNLIVALLGLGCYARSNSLNLANNTTILLIILALLAKNNNNDDNNVEIASTRNTTVNACPCTSNNYSTSARVVYPQPYPTYATGYCYPQHYHTANVVPYQATSACPSACYVSHNSWNYPHYRSNCRYPCHNVLY